MHEQTTHWLFLEEGKFKKNHHMCSINRQSWGIFYCVEFPCFLPSGHECHTLKQTSNLLLCIKNNILYGYWLISEYFIFVYLPYQVINLFQFALHLINSIIIKEIMLLVVFDARDLHKDYIMVRKKMKLWPFWSNVKSNIIHNVTQYCKMSGWKHLLATTSNFISTSV